MTHALALRKKEHKRTAKRKVPTTQPVAKAEIEFVLGCDVSGFQGGNIDWMKVFAAGFRFVYVKATEGATIQDADFARNRASAKAAGLIVGAYHLFRPKTAGQAEIDNFLNTIGTVESGELPPVLDIEVPEDWVNLKSAQRIQLVKDWLTAVEAAVGIRPIIYINNSDAKTVLNNDPSFLDWQLFVADPTTASAPTFPLPWKNYLLWQWNWQGTVDGISVPVDEDRFQGTMEDLRALLKP